MNDPQLLEIFSTVMEVFSVETISVEATSETSQELYVESWRLRFGSDSESAWIKRLIACDRAGLEGPDLSVARGAV